MCKLSRYKLQKVKKYLKAFFLEINECDSSPCLNGGTCFDLINDFRCKCRGSITGKTCNEGNVFNNWRYCVYCYRICLNNKNKDDINSNNVILG